LRREHRLDLIARRDPLDDDVKTIGRELNVRYVLEGSV
jgi:TolB-like protein